MIHFKLKNPRIAIVECSMQKDSVDTKKIQFGWSSTTEYMRWNYVRRRLKK